MLMFEWLCSNFSFLNPSDSENPQIINLLCKQEIRCLILQPDDRFFS